MFKLTIGLFVVSSMIINNFRLFLFNAKIVANLLRLHFFASKLHHLLYTSICFRHARFHIFFQLFLPLNPKALETLYAPNAENMTIP